MSERLRLFVAVDVPAAARSALTTWTDEAAPVEVRRVPAQNLHVTLAFLGMCTAADGAGAGAVLDDVARPVGALRTAGALWLPPRRPGVLAIALEHEAALAELQRDLSVALADAIGFEPERRAFAPHITVGRVRRGTAVRTRDPLQPPALAFPARALTLYRSHTGPAGARYEALARAALDVEPS
ncbi:MAG TPA: RNA 2',3'-cyclic phosphodiesterase [Solirubrobacteraceae bacterium]